MPVRPFLALLAVTALATAAPRPGPLVETGDIPLPPGVRSVRPLRNETTVFATPGARPPRRGTLEPEAIVPLLATSRANGCAGRWLQIGEEAWVCSDAAAMTTDEPVTTPAEVPESGLPFSYYFVGRNGAESYMNLGRALEEGPDTSEEAGFGLAVDEVRDAYGARWGHTSKGRWVKLADLTAARPSAFAGAHLTTAEELATLAWTLTDKVQVFATEKLAGKPIAVLPKHRRVRVVDAQPKVWKIQMDREGEEPLEGFAKAPGQLARPSASATPPEGLSDDERWVDVELATQTLVAYEGSAPVFATLVSTGRGKETSDTGTPRGTYRVWVKLRSTTMANVEDENAESHYSLEEVPWVLFFHKAIAFHGAFWHDDFGRVRSHGCVNLAPRDAAWLYGWAGPAMPAGWNAVLPAPAKPGTLVRVR
jgi:lipoprotein-anchoring transpeptidase ErfK/SrfK